jgi:hydroxymethylpyrimidine/phosphomethylpyrimidine kinase
MIDGGSMKSVALTIAGSDPSGGAGIQADLKTFHQRGVYGTSVVTLVTVQNTQKVSDIMILSPDIVEKQIDAVLEDIPPAAAKTGALGNSEIVEAVAGKAREFSFPLVVDPVMISKHGLPLMTDPARTILAEKLLPCAFLITPNMHEAEEMSGMPVRNPESMEKAAKIIAQKGAKAVLIKGGHLEGEAIDILYWNGVMRRFSSPRENTRHTHGTGCTYSACIVAELAKGRDLENAIDVAKKYITCAIATNPGLGKGAGPVNHHASIDE